jgi:hypothetical protein
MEYDVNQCVIHLMSHELWTQNINVPFLFVLESAEVPLGSPDNNLLVVSQFSHDSLSFVLRHFHLK